MKGYSIYSDSVINEIFSADQISILRHVNSINYYSIYDFDAETSPYFTTFTEEKLDIDGKSFTFSVDYEKLMRGFRNGDYTKVCLGVDYLWESNEKMAYYDSITEYFSQGDLEKIDLYGKAF